MDTTQRDPALETLSEATMAGDPMTQFAGWLAQALERGIPEPTGMVLATTSAEGRPRARTVLLKAHGPEGFTFYTNRTSRKGQDLRAHPQARTRGTRHTPTGAPAGPGPCARSGWCRT